MDLGLMAALKERSALNELDALRKKISVCPPQQTLTIRRLWVQERRVNF
jgi:hypothetical protein